MHFLKKMMPFGSSKRPTQVRKSIIPNLAFCQVHNDKSRHHPQPRKLKDSNLPRNNLESFIKFLQIVRERLFSQREKDLNLFAWPLNSPLRKKTDKQMPIYDSRV